MPDTDPTRMYRGFDCFRDCCRKGDFDDGERASRGCTHPLLPQVVWDVAPDRLVFYLGRYPLISQRGKPPPKEMGPMPQDRIATWWQKPPEPIEDGCPAGWVISPFAQSVLEYRRRRTEGGGRVPNPRFETADRVAQEAALLFEDEQERLKAYQDELVSEKWKRERESGNRNS